MSFKDVQLALKAELAPEELDKARTILILKYGSIGNAYAAYIVDPMDPWTTAELKLLGDYMHRRVNAKLDMIQVSLRK